MEFSNYVESRTPVGTADGSELIPVSKDGSPASMTAQQIADLGGGGGAAEDITFTPAGNISATDVQAALEELDSEKATPAQVAAAIAALVDSSPSTLDTLNELAAALGDDPNFATTLATALGLKAPLASPTFTGTPAAPTAAGGTNTTQVATTAFVRTEIVGIQDLPVSAVAMWPRVSNGCAALQQIEMATSLFNVMTLDFDQTTQEFCQFQLVLPRKWNNGTVTAIFYWTATSGSGDVQWGISGGAYSNDDALTVAFGSAVTVDDTLIAANDLHITSATAAITLAGSPQDADFLAFQISRNPASDTLTADARLLGVTIRITTDAAKDA